jgi:hypothetical protein
MADSERIEVPVWGAHQGTAKHSKASRHLPVSKEARSPQSDATLKPAVLVGSRDAADRCFGCNAFWFSPDSLAFIMEAVTPE